MFTVLKTLLAIPSAVSILVKDSNKQKSECERLVTYANGHNYAKAITTKLNKAKALKCDSSVIQQIQQRLDMVSAQAGKKNSTIHELTLSNFDDKVRKSNSTWVVNFCDGICESCLNFQPKFDSAAQQLGSDAIFATVSDDQLIEQFDVKSLPTVMVFIPGQTEPIVYKETPTSEPLVDFVRRYTVGESGGEVNESSVHKLTDSNFDETVKGSKTVWVIKLSDEFCRACIEFKPEFEKAAQSFSGSINFGEVDVEKNPLIRASFNDIEIIPAVRLVIPGNKSPVTYTGPLTSAAVVDFVRQHTSASPDQSNVESSDSSSPDQSNVESSDSSSPDQSKVKTVASPSDSSREEHSNGQSSHIATTLVVPIQILTDANFSEKLSSSRRFWIVVFSDSPAESVFTSNNPASELITRLGAVAGVADRNQPQIWKFFNVTEPCQRLVFLDNGNVHSIDLDGQPLNDATCATFGCEGFTAFAATPGWQCPCHEDLIEKLTDSNFEEKVRRSNTIWILYPSVLRIVIATQSTLALLQKRYGFRVGIIEDHQTELRKRFDLEGPKLLSPDGKTVTEFTMENLEASFCKYSSCEVLSYYALFPCPCQATGVISNSVQMLGESDFHAKVRNVNFVWVVQFSDGSCPMCAKRMDRAFEVAHRKLMGVAAFGIVYSRAKNSALFDEFHIGHSVEIKIFVPGQKLPINFDTRGGEDELINLVRHYTH